jgi:hypothetical protein
MVRDGGAAGGSGAPRSTQGRFALTSCLAVVIGVLIAAVAYAVGCLVFLWKHHEVVGRLVLAARNVAIVLMALAVMVVLAMLIDRLLGRRWRWILVAFLAGLAAVCGAILYSSPTMFQVCRVVPDLDDASDIAAGLRLQLGQRLALPADVSAVELRYANAHAETIVLNDRCAQPLFGLNLPKLTSLHAGGDITIIFSEDWKVKKVYITDE